MFAVKGKKLRPIRLLPLVCALALVAAPVRASIINGQVDDFEDGTVMNWSGGASPTNIGTGGPAGAGDNYLQITSTGFAGPSGSMASFNDFQWSGDYIANNVTSISADMVNFSSTPLQMRVLLLFSPGGNFTSTLPVALPADGLWHSLSFSLAPGALTFVGGFGTGIASDTLSSLGRLLIRHQSGAPLGQGGTTPIAAQVGIDNITAVPEPATFVLLLSGLTLIARRRR
jgi:hypothetical protein